ncbi:MAG: hypothetical protein JXD18_11430 [Anaerolineae bacterium]|nr:hypothetical protein [Anaerolineae bacterium]
MELQLPTFLLSPFGRRVTSVMAVAILGITAYTFKKTYTPGPLSEAHPNNEPLCGYESHASFEDECLHCHAPVHCLSADRCQTCHIDVAQQRQESDGLHGLLPGTDKCQRCHNEHGGREAVLTEVAFINIDHTRLTGFALARHALDYDGAAMACENCHGPDEFAAATVDCVTCHTAADPLWMDEHLAEFGSACTPCHDGVDRMSDFEHDAAFPLADGHAGLECADCHAGYVFATPPRDCVACHVDPEVHLGQFGLDCSRCHTAVAWTPAELTRHVFRLDHGDEGEVPCETCHTGSYTFYTCDECHEPDQARIDHLGYSFASLDECARCHPTGAPGEGAVQAASEEVLE